MEPSLPHRCAEPFSWVIALLNIAVQCWIYLSRVRPSADKFYEVLDSLFIFSSRLIIRARRMHDESLAIARCRVKYWAVDYFDSLQIELRARTHCTNACECMCMHSPRGKKAIAICSWRGTDRARGVFACGAAGALWILGARKRLLLQQLVVTGQFAFFDLRRRATWRVFIIHWCTCWTGCTVHR